MDAFVYQAQPQRVVFGFGTLSTVGEEIARLGVRRALVLSTPQQRDAAENLARTLGQASAGVFAGATMHTPVEVTQKALAELARMDADCVVALGGGSTMGLGKAIALRTDVPQIAIPTTYAGSEATPILGETQNKIKTTQRSPKVLPEVIIYDVDLTLTLPPALSVTSGLNAIAHAVEALYTQDRNPIISLLAVEGIRALVKALPPIRAEPGNREARSDALYGAWACGTCLGAVGMALHHKICHVLGGTFDLPHAETHAVILPHAVSYNEEAAAEQLRPLREVLGTGHLGQALYDLSRSLGAPMTLKEIGMAYEDLDEAAEAILASPYWNPAPVEKSAILRLLQNAFEGKMSS